MARFIAASLACRQNRHPARRHPLPREQAMNSPQRIAHPLAPLFDARSRVLILGTMPSPKSREAGFYYGNPQNRFWKVLARLFDEEEPLGITERSAFATAHRIALWDVLASCTIDGASDASIEDPIPNDLGSLACAAPLEAAFTTGTKAASLYRRFQPPELASLPHIALPSTSPANARMSLDDLVAAYRPIVSYCG